MTWVSATRRLLWGKNNYLKYSPQQRQQRRLTMLLNLIAIDAIIQQEGGGRIVTEKQGAEWIAKYESQNQTPQPKQ